MMLKKAIDSVNSTELLERLLIQTNKDTSCLLEEGGGGVELDRIAMEFNNLRHNMSVIDSANIPLVRGLTRVSIVFHIIVLSNLAIECIYPFLPSQLPICSHTLLITTYPPSTPLPLSPLYPLLSPPPPTFFYM